MRLLPLVLLLSVACGVAKTGPGSVGGDTDPETVPETDAETDTEEEPDADSDTSGDPDTDRSSDTDRDSDTDPDADTDRDSDTDHDSDSDSDQDSDQDSDSDSDSDQDTDADADTFDTSFSRRYFEIDSARWFLVAGIGADGGLSNFVANSASGGRAEFPSELTYILSDGADACYITWEFPVPLTSADTDTDTDGWTGHTDTDTDAGGGPVIGLDLALWLLGRGLDSGFQLDLTAYEATPVVDDNGAPCDFDPTVYPAGFDWHSAFLQGDAGTPVPSMNVGLTTTPLTGVTLNGTPTPPVNNWYNAVLQNPGTLNFTNGGVVTTTRDYPMAGFAYRLDIGMGTLPTGASWEYLERSQMTQGAALSRGLHIMQGVITIGY